jgi:hypothetical protein
MREGCQLRLRAADDGRELIFAQQAAFRRELNSHEVLL